MPLPDAQALAASTLRPPAAGPAANGIAPAQPAGTPKPGDNAGGRPEPFAALLLGFLQATQPAAPTVSALVTDGDTSKVDAALRPDSATDAAELPALALVVVPGQQTPTGALAIPASGTALPATGSSLPPVPSEPAAGQSFSAPPAAEAELSAAIPATRISLADIEHSRELNMAASTAPVQADIKTWIDRFRPLPPSSVPDLASDSTADPQSDTGAVTGSTLLQSAGLTAGDLSRLVHNLSQGGSRETFSAVFSSAGSTSSSLFSEAGATTANTQGTASSGLGNMVRSSLSGFPPLQPLGSAQAWTTGLGDRLLTLAGPGTHSARLRLHPESLGTLDIEIKIADSTAQVWFGAQHSHTREAIEASLPQLREMFAEQGIRLAHAQVDSGTDRRPPDQQQGFNEAPVGRNGWQQASTRSSLPDALTPVRQAANRLLDAWA